MNRRLTRVGLAAVLTGSALLLCVACSDPSSPVSSSSSAPSTTAAITASGDSTVSLTVPAVFFEGVWEEDPRAVLDDYHCLDIVQNDDGSYTVSLTQENYGALVERVYDDAKGALLGLASSQDHPHVTAVDFDEQFATVTVTLDTQDLSVVEPGLPYIPGGIACGYQLIAGLPVSCDVILVGPDGTSLLEEQFPPSEPAE